MPKNITHLSLPEHTRMLANMRAAQLRLNLSEYIGNLVRADAEDNGLLDLVEDDEQGVGHGDE